jgi:hypothetical protein
MTVQQLRKVIDEIRTAIKPENPKCLIVIYDHRIRGDSKKIRHAGCIKTILISTIG